MTSRSEELRRKYRTIFAWSLGVAVIVHVVIFVVMPRFHAKSPLAGDAKGGPPNAIGGPPTMVLLVFGPPTLTKKSGGTWTEPPDHMLRTTKLTRSTGDRCGDEILTEMADALVYHWLPTERFPAPVDLLQPVTVIGARR